MRNSYKTIGLWVILIILFVAFYQLFSGQKEMVKNITYSDFQRYVTEQKIKAVTIKGNIFTGTLADSNERFVTTGPAADSVLVRDLTNQGVNVGIEKPEESSLWVSILGQWLPIVFLFLFFIFFMRQLQGSGGKAMTFGKSKAKLLSESHNKITFADVAGIEECKEELEEIISFLKDPKKFTKLGGRIPKGVLMMGSPGTGK
ncbi:MAG: ATP-dependent metallopeptidase FtsH/Yme1/Tma family protein, partial [Archangium sp.]